MNTSLALLLAALLFGATPALAQDATEADTPTEEADDSQEMTRKERRQARQAEEEAEAGDEDVTTFTGEIPDKPWVNYRTKWGVFGHAFSGLTFGSFGSLEDDLTSGDPEDPDRMGLGNNFSLKNLGAIYGGNVDFVIGRYIMIGGGGMGMWFNAAESTPEYNDQGEIQDSTDFVPGQVSTSAQFFTGHIGFLALHKARYAKNEADQRQYKYSVLLYPYVGGGIGMINAKLNNYSANVIGFGDLDVEQAAFQEIEASTPVIEAGVSTRFAFDKNGGVMLGFDLGGYFAIGGDWEDENGNAVAGVDQGTMAGGYFRMTLGGGFLSLKPRNEWKKRSPKPESSETEAAIDE